MKLLRLTVAAVRGVPDGSYMFSAPATGAPFDTVFVTGTQDSGKTSLLEAVAATKEAIGSYGLPPDVSRMLRKGASRGHTTSTWLLSPADRTRCEVRDAEQTVRWEFGDGGSSVDASPRLRRLFGAYSNDPEHGKFEFFPANRSLRAGESFARRPVSDASEVRYRMTGAPEKYAGLRYHLRDLVLADAGQLVRLLDTQGIALRTRQPDAIGPYREAIAAVLPNVRLASVEPEDRSARVFFHKRDGAIVELDELSASEQQGVLFATTFRRFGLNHSVVLIDSPELFIHPCRQADFFAAIVALSRNNQIIAATTSQELLSTVRPEHIIDLSRLPASKV